MAYKLKELDEFKESCNKRRCLRATTYNSKTCVTEYKQSECYKKYIAKAERDNEKFAEKMSNKKNHNNVDNGIGEVTKEIWLKRIIWKRESGCEYDGNSKKKNWVDYDVFWNYIFTTAEKEYIVKNQSTELWLNENLDLMHIDSVGRSPEEKYNPNNVVLSGTLWHSRIDRFKDPVTLQDMSNDDREIWLQKLRNYIKEIQ